MRLHLRRMTLRLAAIRRSHLDFRSDSRILLTRDIGILKGSDEGRVHRLPGIDKSDEGTHRPSGPFTSRHFTSGHFGMRPCMGLRQKHLGLRVLLATLILLTACVLPNATAMAVDLVDGRDPSELGLPASALPDIKADAGILTSDDGRVLWSRNMTSQHAIASLTKIMTAVVALEHSKPDEMVTVPAAAKKVGESTSFLVPGSKILMGDLLKALLVKSGNDAAVTVAVHVGGDEEHFVTMMNEKAADLGLSGTHFMNSHGLDMPGHYSTAEDLAVLSRYAMSIPLFEECVSVPVAEVVYPEGTKKLDNTNLLIGNYRGANGVKTGYTKKAGYCLASSAKRGDTQLYAVVLGTSSDRARLLASQGLLDWGFAHYREVRIASQGAQLGEACVISYLDRTVVGEVSEDTTLTVFDVAGQVERKIAMVDVKAPVVRGQKIGVATFSQNERVVATIPLVATEDVKAPNIFERVWVGMVRLGRKISG